MEETLSNIYLGFLDTSNLDVNQQERILKHALRKSDINLLAKLALYSTLDQSIDQELRDVPFAQVKAAWASRPGRSEVDLKNLVEKEKRVKVHAALAERVDLPQSLYLVIAQKAKGKGALNALLQNSYATTESKEIAGRRLFSEIGEHADGEMYNNYRTSTDISNIFATVPTIIQEIVSTSRNIQVLTTAASSYALEEDGITNLLNLLDISIKNSETKNRPNYNNLSRTTFDYVCKVYDDILENSQVNENLIERMSKTLKNLDKKYANTNTSNYYRDSIATTQDGIKNYKPTPLFDYISAIEALTSIEEGNSLADKFLLDLKNSNKYSTNVTSGVIYALTRSKFVTPDKLDELLEDYHYGWYMGGNLKKATSDPLKLGVIISHFLYMGLDPTLKVSSDPEATFRELLSRLVKQGASTLSEEITNSRYFTEAVALDIPLKLIYNTDGLSGIFNQKIVTYLQNQLKDQVSWVTFENLVGEFNGSTKDLIHVVNNI